MVSKLPLIYLVITVLILNITLISSEIIINQPKSLYNLGDELSVNIKIDSIKQGYLDVYLICNSQTQNIYHNVPDSKDMSIKRVLTQEYIGNISGDCNIQVVYSNEIKTSQNFVVSTKINLKPEITKIEYRIGQTIAIKGTAIKENNELVGQLNNAFVQIYLSENITKTEEVKNSQFSVDFPIPDTTPSGVYKLRILVYDLDSNGNRLNSGQSEIELNVIQKPSKIDIATDKENLLPEEEIKILAILYDKSNSIIPEQLAIRIKDAKDKQIYEAFIKSNEEFLFKLDNSASPGLASITAQKDNITSEKAFQIKELKKLSAEIINQTLNIRNTGNIPYKGSIEIQVAEKKILKDVNLGLNEESSFAISAPDGEYSLLVKGENQEELLNQGKIFLTGSTISIKELNDRASILFLNYPIIWIFLFIILAVYLFVWYKKKTKSKALNYLKNTSKSKMSTNFFGFKNKKENIQIENQEEKSDILRLQGAIKKAEQVLVLDGEKEQVSVIAIKIKNSLSSTSNENLSKFFEYAYQSKGVIYSKDSNITILFSPSVTGVKNNDEIALKAAIEIEKAINKYNQLFRDRIEFGIGANTGDLITKIEGKILKFTNMGRTIITARKIAEASNSEVLLSREIHEKTMNNIKTDKTLASGIEVFKIKRIVNTEESKKFISEFLRKNS